MNWTDKDIDNLYKSKASNSSFEYKDSYWKEMEAMLPKNSGKDFLWMITAFISLGIVAVSFLNTNSFNNNSPLFSENTTSSTRNETGEKNTTKQNVTITSLINEINHDEVLHTNQHERKSNRKAASKNSPKNINNSALSNTTNEDVHFNQTTEMKKKSTSSNDLNNGIFVNTESELNTSSVTNVDANNKQNKQNAVTTEKISTKLSLKKVTLLPQQKSELAPSSIPDPFPMRKQFYAQLLGGMSQSMVTPSNTPSYNIGVGVGLQINKGRLVINTGINGLWSLHNNLLLTREAKIYSFGSDVVQYEIKYKELFYLEADLSIGYQMSNHILRIGVRPSYIIGTKAGYREQKLTDEISNNYYGITSGINRLGIKPMIGYTYLLKRDLSIGLNIGMQLIPLIDNNFISGMNRNLPIDGQIFIRKTIHFRK